MLIDAFLNEVHKKKVSNEIRQRNWEKKLQAQESLPAHPEEKMSQELNSVIQPCNNSTSEVTENVDLGSLKCPTSDPVIHDRRRVFGGSRSHKKKVMDELKHELFNPPSESASINHNNVTDAEDRANRANQEEILCWCLYWKDFRSLDEIIRSGGGKFGEKKARSILYGTITEQLSIFRKKRPQGLGLQLRDVSRDSLRKKTQRAEKIYKLIDIGIMWTNT